MEAWLTPDEPPEHKWYTRLVRIPAALDFYSAVSGALVQLTYPHNWEQYGTLTPQETAAIFATMYDLYCKNDNEPPEWESPGDLDGEPTQPWYEDLADWIIAGFLAITFTPQAAIVYQATVPKIRVAFRTGNIGALFRVLINGIELWTGDSYAPIVDILSRDFDVSSYDTPYTIRIEHNGIGGGYGSQAKLEYIRGEVLGTMLATILRAEPEGCGIQWSQDDGDVWNTIDLSTCITGLANDAIITAIDNGVIAAPGQGGPTPAPAPGHCASYKVHLIAAGAWVCPQPVSTNDTITVTGATGAWNDGSGFGAIGPWKCPDGSQYGLGECGEPGSPQEGDPLPTAVHMTIVGHTGSAWFDPATLYTVPSGVVNDQLVMQANDAALADNLGAVDFTVTVCVGGAWSQEFTGEALHSLLSPLYSGWATWNDTSQRWEANYIADAWRLYVLLSPFPVLADGHYLTEASDVNPPGGDMQRLYSDPDRGGSLLLDVNVGAFDFPSGWVGGGSLLINPDNVETAYLSTLTLTGTGTNPFV